MVGASCRTHGYECVNFKVLRPKQSVLRKFSFNKTMPSCAGAMAQWLSACIALAKESQFSSSSHAGQPKLPNTPAPGHLAHSSSLPVHSVHRAVTPPPTYAYLQMKIQSFLNDVFWCMAQKTFVKFYKVSDFIYHLLALLCRSQRTQTGFNEHRGVA